MKKKTFSYKTLAAFLKVIAFSLSLIVGFSNKSQSVQAQEGECVIGDITIEIDVFCWAVDAVSFTVSNGLFSILDQEDMRDAVKHYRFYNLIMNELQ